MGCNAGFPILPQPSIAQYLIVLYPPFQVLFFRSLLQFPNNRRNVLRHPLHHIPHLRNPNPNPYLGHPGLVHRRLLSRHSSRSHPLPLHRLSPSHNLGLLHPLHLPSPPMDSPIHLHHRPLLLWRLHRGIGAPLAECAEYELCGLDGECGHLGGKRRRDRG